MTEFFPIQITPKAKKFFWGQGPWVNESDYEEFEIDSVKCSIERVGRYLSFEFEDYLELFEELEKENPEHTLVKNPPHFGGHLCGYVQLPEGHPWEEIDCEDIPVDIHGGITFHERIKDRIWVGFDCANSHDIIPSGKTWDKVFSEKWEPKIPNSPIWNKSYKTWDFVKKEVIKLVEQVKKSATTP